MTRVAPVIAYLASSTRSSTSGSARRANGTFGVFI